MKEKRGQGMPDRIAQKLNRRIDDCLSVEELYMPSVLVNEPRASGCRDINAFMQIKGFQSYGTLQSDRNLLNKLSEKIIGASLRSEKPIVYTFYSDGEKIHIFYGMDGRLSERVEAEIQSELADVEIERKWIKKEKIKEVQKFGGFVYGAGQNVEDVIDDLLRGCPYEPFMISILIWPISEEKIESELIRTNNLINEYREIQSRRNLGNNYWNQRGPAELQEVNNLLETLDKIRNKLENGKVSGLWKCVIYVSAEQKNIYQNVISKVELAVTKGNEIEADFGRAHHVDSSFLFLENQPELTWNIPRGCLGRNNYDGLFSDTLINVVNHSTARGLFQLPYDNHNGYRVVLHDEERKKLHPFDGYEKKRKNEEDMHIGYSDGTEFFVQKKDFYSHAFIAGRTRSGKSTTIRKLLFEIHKKKIPFLVIEPAKREYCELLRYEELKNVRVFSCGNDARDFRLNPFQPEEGTMYSRHAEGLSNVFLTLFSGDDVVISVLIPQLIRYCYEKCGIRLNSRYYKDDEFELPTISDMIDWTEEFIKSIHYEPETERQAIAVITLRENLLKNYAGNFFDTRDNFDVAVLFESSAIVELDDLDGNLKGFVASLLALRVDEYSRQLPEEGGVKRVLVLEEAHHLVPNIERKETTPVQVICSKYFTNMLAEIAAFGTGLIVVDQRPSCVSSAVIANTGMKIIHSMQQKDDVEAVCNSLHIETTSVLNVLKTGEVVVSLPGKAEIYKVQIEKNMRKFEQGDAQLLARIFGKNRCVDMSNVINAIHIDKEMEQLKNKLTQTNLEECLKKIAQCIPQKMTREEEFFVALTLVENASSDFVRKRQILHKYS